MLITTFAPWKAHQPSNASDDLLAYMAQQQLLPAPTRLMRQVPVSFDLAPCRVIAKLVELRPPVVVCCGMAESRPQLDLELNAKRYDQVMQTPLDLDWLRQGTCLTAISHCAGDYVCNHLYFEVLTFIRRHRWPTTALFIHIPCLTPENRPWLAADLALILRRLSQVSQLASTPLAA